MKPAEFEYQRPTSLAEALDLLHQLGDEATLLAGGQSLIPLMCLRLARPETIVDLAQVSGLDEIHVGADVVSIGAMVTAAQVERSAEVAEVLPLLRAGLRHLAHPQIRNRTTVGGNIAHADPASELPALLATLGGAVWVRSVDGERSVGWDEFFRGPFMNSRRPQEVVVGVEWPILRGYRFGFSEFARRHGDYGLAAAAVGLRVESGVVRDVRIGVAGLGPTPLRASATERALVGLALDDIELPALVSSVEAEVDPAGDAQVTAAHRRALAGVVVGRAFSSAGKDASE
jgi:carbon-monoxide dehydrogenase medium subunit